MSPNNNKKWGRDPRPMPRRIIRAGQQATQDAEKRK